MKVEEIISQLQSGAAVVIPTECFGELEERMSDLSRSDYRLSLKFSPKGTVTIKMIK